MKMKALKSFCGKEGDIRIGREFEAASENRARELEAHGLAARILHPVYKLAQNPQAQNKAAETGPLPSAGGGIGAEQPPSSSEADHQPARRRSTRRAAEPE